MKTILLFAIMLVSTLTFAQDETKQSVTPYIAAGLSMTNGNDFTANTYVSVEAGVMVSDWSVGGVFGRNNLISNTPETIDNYWWEIKTAFSYSLNVVSIYGVIGLGAYIDRDNGMFIEYGGGVSKELGNFGLFVQATNWDGIWYVTPGLSYSFSKK